jgi:hypothetical protein
MASRGRLRSEVAMRCGVVKLSLLLVPGMIDTYTQDYGLSIAFFVSYMYSTNRIPDVTRNTCNVTCTNIKCIFTAIEPY